MKQTIVLFTILISLLYAVKANADVAWANSNRPVTHLFVGDETLWFLAQVYYGNGDAYKKIMAANGLTSPQKVSEGVVLSIPNPKFLPTDAKFAERYTALNDKRMKLLAAQGSSLGSPASVIADKAPKATPEPAASLNLPPSTRSTAQSVVSPVESARKPASAESAASKPDNDKLALVRSFASISETAPKAVNVEKAKRELEERPATEMRPQKNDEIKRLKAE